VQKKRSRDPPPPNSMGREGEISTFARGEDAAAMLDLRACYQAGTKTLSRTTWVQLLFRFSTGTEGGQGPSRRGELAQRLDG